mmetsp:Transcript_60966/g.175639  ORF Transcript_60966/g.175639 Transcript_60966/m.175639 type:complete len:405 (-) Transcript_60966:62-1276(-)|eukprot:CAMPEP_0176077166 /NCGR_PEP_ID=MMETSP0120_2-20121206/38581_1 /TAXON_ID=160619 /ORGANISM="Kryptoperidinium foliaceum, Strain CCMP 1326" /LENGTH=404 /DNA_ID=CAMNT_0017410895 /DNA_START=27 /DNA_END=1241 /DNA_ORIENTATION=+
MGGSLGTSLTQAVHSAFGERVDLRILLVGDKGGGKGQVLKRLKLQPLLTDHPDEPGIQRAERQRSWGSVRVTVCENDLPSAAVLSEDDFNAIIFIVDLSDVEAVGRMKGKLEQLLEEQTLAGLPLLVIAHSKDGRAARLTAPDLVQALGLNSIWDRRWSVHGMEAAGDSGVFAGIEWLAAQQVVEEATGPTRPLQPTLDALAAQRERKAKLSRTPSWDISDSSANWQRLVSEQDWDSQEEDDDDEISQTQSMPSPRCSRALSSGSESEDEQDDKNAAEDAEPPSPSTATPKEPAMGLIKSKGSARFTLPAALDGKPTTVQRQGTRGRLQRQATRERLQRQATRERLGTAVHFQAMQGSYPTMGRERVEVLRQVIALRPPLSTATPVPNRVFPARQVVCVHAVKA